MPAPPSIAGPLVTALGESDCEDLDVASLVQPINAVTSLAFSIVGLALLYLAMSVGLGAGRDPDYFTYDLARWLLWLSHVLHRPR